MKLRMILICLILGTISLQSCNDDDSSQISDETKQAFAAKYPNASAVEWEIKSGYFVAEFKNNNADCSAWFDSKGMWYMTETDINYAMLPVAVKTNFEASKYATWKKDDIDKLERKDLETLYCIEVELNDQEVDLYYSETGVLVKTIIENDDNDHVGLLPESTPSEIQAFITKEYPGASILDIDYDKTVIEVDIIHNNIKKEVIFNLNKEWIQTSWDIAINIVPENIRGIIAKNYSAYTIDEVDLVVSASQKTYYLFELEKIGSPDLYVKINEEGEILNP